MKRNINTEKRTETQRKTPAKFARTARTSPSWGAPKARRGGEPTNRRLNGTGGEVHPMGRDALTLE